MCNGEINGIGKNIDIFDVVITKCSLKNLDRSYKTTIKMKTTINMNKNEMKNGDIYNHCSGGMYYCTECLSMHHENSRIGKLHKKDE